MALPIDAKALVAAIFGPRRVGEPFHVAFAREAIPSLARRGHPGPMLEVLRHHRRPNPTQDDPIEAAINALESMQPHATTDVQST